MWRVVFLVLAVSTFSFADHSAFNPSASRSTKPTRETIRKNWDWTNWKRIDMSDSDADSAYSVLKHLTSYRLFDKENGGIKYFVARLHCKKTTYVSKFAINKKEEVEYACFFNDSETPTFTKEWAKELMLALKSEQTLSDSSPVKKDSFYDIQTEEIWAQNLDCRAGDPAAVCSFDTGKKRK